MKITFCFFSKYIYTHGVAHWPSWLHNTYVLIMVWHARCFLINCFMNLLELVTFWYRVTHVQPALINMCGLATAVSLSCSTEI